MKYRLRHIYWIIMAGIVFLSGTVSAQINDGSEAHGLFVRADTAYKTGDYDAALADYHRILAAGWESGPLYYNLGNCYVKKDQPGRAILNYERARFFIPNDADLESNYRFALSMLPSSPPYESNPVVRSLARLFDRVSINGMSVLLSVLYIAVIIVLLVRLWMMPFRKPGLYMIAVLVISFALTAVSFASRKGHMRNGAVVVSAVTAVRFEPMANGTIYFTLNEGASVRIVSQNQDWYKILRSDGKSGWVPAGDIEPLFPRG